MGEKLSKILYKRASNSKDPKSYVETAEQLYKLMGLSDEEFIKEMDY